MKKFLFTTVLVLCSFLALAQGVQLKGTVLDKSGAPVIGASVLLTGTLTGAVTDIDGHFTLEIKTPLDDKSTLTFSCIGYSDVKQVIGKTTNFNVVLEESATFLNETVVVGYSTVKKRDLTGSVSTLEGDKVLQRQTQEVTQALQGAISGVTVTRTNSSPGSEASIRIRGITSMTEGATDPYILIDGVPGTMSDVNPNDIENITVLKDAASASIYGSQAAAGVILITTKRAKSGKAGVQYSFTLGIDSPTKMPEYMDAVSYMDACNELRYNDTPASGWYQAYPKEYVENYWALNAMDPDTYPNCNWQQMVLKDYAIRQSHSLKFNVSKDKVSSSVSLGLDNTEGLYKANQNWRRYTARINNDLQIYKWLKLSADVSLRYIDQINPHSSPASKMRYMPAVYQAVWSDGRYAPGKDASNIYAALMSGGEKTTKKFHTTAKFQLDANPLDGLTITALYSPRLGYSSISDFQRQTAYYYQDELVSNKYIAEALTTTLDETRGSTYEGTFQAYVNYQKTFGKLHNFGAMAGYENYYLTSNAIIAGNSDFATTLIQDLKAGNPAAATATSSDVYELARNSFFGRLMYNYDKRYYVQANIRCDGSSRFAPENRWGTFLSASAGWEFTNEKWMKNAKRVLNHGKLRVSYGELGNERIQGYYPYQSMLSVSHPVAYVGDAATAITGYAQSAAVIRNLTWEKTATTDIGIDLALFRNRLTFTADYYYKNTTGMLIEVQVAPVVGLSSPYNNLGDMYTNGWEFTIGWKDTVGDFTYKVDFNLSDDVSIMGNLHGKQVISNGKIIASGYEYASWYGYKTNGLFQTQEEVSSSPTLGTQYPGDVKYVNIDDAPGSGKIINAEKDRVVLGSSLPHLNFGGNISLYWKGIDFNLTFQGVGKRNGYLTDEMVQPLRGQVYNFPKYLSGSASWSYKNTIQQNLNAKYPRYSWNSGGSTSTVGNYAYSDYWIIDGSYFRIKNISIGYTLPDKWLNAIHAKTVRLGVSLSDFFTFSHYPEGWDPEVGTTSYPITKSVLFSLTVGF